MKKVISFWTAVLLVVSLLAGCDTPAPAEPQTTDAPSSATVETAAPTEAPAEVPSEAATEAATEAAPEEEEDIVYEGDALYTVDLSQLSEDDFSVNNETKTLTVRIPYAELSPIHIPADQIKFHDVKKGWAAPKDIKLTPQENARLTTQVSSKMKAKLIDDNIIAVANQSAKTVVAELLSATVHAVDPEFTVVVVQ